MRWRTLAVLLSLASFAHPTRADEGKTASSPDEVIALVNRAIEAGDADAFLGLLISPAQLSLKLGDREAQLNDRFEKACLAIFGKKSGRRDDTTRARLTRAFRGLKSVELKAKKEWGSGRDLVELTVRVTTVLEGKETTEPSTWACFKEGGSWKLWTDVDPADLKRFRNGQGLIKEWTREFEEQAEKQVERQSKAAKVVRDVNARKIRTLDAAVRAYDLALGKK